MTPKSFGFLVLVLLSVALGAIHIPICSTNHILGDESIVFWIWNQPFLSLRFFQSVTSNTAAPPGDFLCGAFVYRVLNFLAPIWTSDNLELSTRIYSMFIMTLATFFLGLGVWEITESWIASLLATILFTKLSPEVNYYFCEVRFYPALYLFSTIVWVSYLRAQKTMGQKDSWPVRVSAYLISCSLAVWFHVYCIVTISATIVALAFEMKAQDYRSLWNARVIRRIFPVVVGNFLMWAYYAYKFHGNKPIVSPADLFSKPSLIHLWVRWLQILNGLYPHFTSILFVILGISVCVLCIDGARKNAPLLIFPIVLAASMAQNIVHASMWYMWEPRYVIYVLPSFFFSLTILLAVVRRLKLPFLSGNYPIYTHPVLVLILTAGIFAIIPLKSRKTFQTGGDPWVRMRRQILQDDLKISGVIGIRPGPLGLEPENGTYCGWSWYLYLKGIKGLPWLEDLGEDRLFWKADRWLDRHFPFTRAIWPRKQSSISALSFLFCKDSSRFHVLQPGEKSSDPVFANYCADPVLVSGGHG